MKTKLLALFTMAIAFNAHAEKVGNGGGAHVCRDATGKITSIQMYDLYEGVNRYGFKGDLPAATNATEIFNQAIQRIRDAQLQSLAAKIENAKNILENSIILTNAQLLSTMDAHPIMVDRGCGYEQIANWDDRSGKVQMNRELFQALDPMSTAALYLHEAAYYIARVYSNQNTSDDTRELVGQIFYHQKINTTIASGAQTAEITTKVGYHGSDIYPHWAKKECYTNNSKTHPETYEVNVRLLTLKDDHHDLSTKKGRPPFSLEKTPLFIGGSSVSTERTLGLQYDRFANLAGSPESILIHANPKAIRWGDNNGWIYSSFEISITKKSCGETVKGILKVDHRADQEQIFELEIIDDAIQQH